MVRIRSGQQAGTKMAFNPGQFGDALPARYGSFAFNLDKIYCLDAIFTEGG